MDGDWRETRVLVRERESRKRGKEGLFMLGIDVEGRLQLATIIIKKKKQFVLFLFVAPIIFNCSDSPLLTSHK